MKADRVLIYCAIIDRGLEIGVKAACRGEYRRGAGVMGYIHNLPGTWRHGLRGELNFLDMNRRGKGEPNEWVKKLEEDMLQEPEVIGALKKVNAKQGRVDWMEVIKALGGAVGEAAKVDGKGGRDVIYANLLRDCILSARAYLWGCHGGPAIDAMNHARRLPLIIGRDDWAMEWKYLEEDCSRLRIVQPRMAEWFEVRWTELRESLAGAAEAK